MFWSLLIIRTLSKKKIRIPFINKRMQQIFQSKSETHKSIRFQSYISSECFVWEKKVCKNIFFHPWLVIFCNQFGKEIKRVFYLIRTFTLQFCCSSPSIKTHIISLQSVINNVYIFHMNRFEGKKKEISMWNYA